jgi:molecular chaperone HscB
MQWAVRVNEAYQRLKDPLQRARLPVRTARRADQGRAQHRHAGGLPDAADGSGARRWTSRATRPRGGGAGRAGAVQREKRTMLAELTAALDERSDTAAAAARCGR